MAISYEDLRKANSAVRTTNIQGKEYAEVNQRIKAFRMVFPEGFIHTGMTTNENGVCIFWASVGYYDEHGNPLTLGMGTAYEKENSSFINKTSYIENCETSAVGRALGMAGFGIDTSVASAEEVGNAILNQKDTKKPAPKAEPSAKTTEQMAKEMNLSELPTDRKDLYQCLTEIGTDLNKVAVAYKYKTIDEVPVDKLQQALVRKLASKMKSAGATA